MYHLPVSHTVCLSKFRSDKIEINLESQTSLSHLNESYIHTHSYMHVVVRLKILDVEEKLPLLRRSKTVNFRKNRELSFKINLKLIILNFGIAVVCDSIRQGC